MVSLLWAWGYHSESFRREQRPSNIVSPRATRTMHSAVWNARESRCAGWMGRRAARRKTITARAVPVRCGTIRSFARASRPLSVITCWCIPLHPSQFRSGGRCNDDQLTLMSMIRPRRTSKTETNSGNSREICPVRGHHAPSISSPSREASVSRTGLAGRRVTTGLIMPGVGSAAEVAVPAQRCSNKSTMTSVIGFCWGATVPSSGSARFMGQPFAVRSDRPESRADGGIALPVTSFAE
jgi:hypothetical protein